MNIKEVWTNQDSRATNNYLISFGPKRQNKALIG